MIAYTTHDLALPVVLEIIGFLWAIVLWRIRGQRWVPPKWSFALGWLGTLGGLAFFIAGGVLTYLRTR